MKRVIFVFWCVFCVASVSLFALETNECGTSACFKGPVGLQMYSLRSICEHDVEAGMKLAAEMGFRYIEASKLYNVDVKEYRALADKYGLIICAKNYDFSTFESDAGIDFVIEESKILGNKFAGVAWIPHKAPFDEADARRAAAVFNRAGERMAKEGLTFVFHNHGFEFQPWKDGKTLFDLLMEETNPDFVSFEMDVLWTIFPNQDPVALLKKYPNRWKLFHLKDLRGGVEGNLSGHTSVENDVTLGSGQADYPAILKAAQEAGVEYYFIEDESPRFQEQIPQSLRFLEQIEF
ncbi:MAG: sugar phosphate isomerase/epimerase [Planctomycetia bacterium]|nr:sugar phosphate isomerase/epimerase [Planctomycetia bacterium]